MVNSASALFINAQHNKPTTGRPTSPIPDLRLPANRIIEFHLRRLMWTVPRFMALCSILLPAAEYTQDIWDFAL